MDETPLFRANKRRKFIRQKQETSELNSQTEDQPSNQDISSVGDDDVDVTTLIKTRKQARPRATGVLFSQQKRFEGGDEPTNTLDLVKVDPEEERLRQISNRFVGSTGQVVDDDKHMFVFPSLPQVLA